MLSFLVFICGIITVYLTTKLYIKPLYEKGELPFLNNLFHKLEKKKIPTNVWIEAAQIMSGRSPFLRDFDPLHSVQNSIVSQIGDYKATFTNLIPSSSPMDKCLFVQSGEDNIYLQQCLIEVLPPDVFENTINNNTLSICGDSITYKANDADWQSIELHSACIGNEKVVPINERWSYAWYISKTLPDGPGRELYGLIFLDKQTFEAAIYLGTLVNVDRNGDGLYWTYSEE